MADRYALSQYLDLMDEFLSGRASAAEFEERYLKKFKADSFRRPRRIFDVLDRLFAEVDSYVADPSLRDPGDLDDEMLIDRVAHARERLSNKG